VLRIQFCEIDVLMVDEIQQLYDKQMMLFTMEKSFQFD
jgi:hypothetical protein